MDRPGWAAWTGRRPRRRPWWRRSPAADIDFRGLLGHDKSVRNGFSDIRYTVTIQSPASEAQVRRCKETIDRKSPVGDTLANAAKITSRFVFKPS
jgi:hypothetical protein